MWDQKAYHKQWRANNRDKLKSNTIKYRYGLSSTEYEDLKAKADTCNICGSTFSSEKDKHVDHNHITKRVRGVLCTKCNVGLGMFMDNKDLLYTAASYLLENEIQSDQALTV